MLMALVASLGGVLIGLASAERQLTGNVVHAEAAGLAAESALARAALDLREEPGWTAVLQGARVSSLSGGPLRRAGGTRQVDLAAETVAWQATSDSLAVWGADNPRWRLYAWGTLADLTPSVPFAGAILLAVWVGDDGEEVDGDPGTDTNGVVRVRAEAFGPGQARRAVEAAVERVGAPPGGVLRVRGVRAQF